MSSVDLKIVGVTMVTIAAYTVVANIIPQVESDVPPDVAFGADVTPEELVDAGSVLYEGAGGCVACHAETPGARAPNLRTDYRGQGPIGVRCADRIPGMECKEYLYQALVRPNDHIVDDYPPIMPPVDRTLSQPQIWALVAYLESMGGEVTVTAADIPDEPEPGEPGAPAAPGVGPTLATTDPGEIIRELCVQCHVYEGAGLDLGPDLDGIGARRSAQELRLAILDPPAVVSEGYEDFVGLMPVDFGRQLTAEQLEAVVSYLSGLR
jgi:mono/diheme cytochrome c family protein